MMYANLILTAAVVSAQEGQPVLTRNAETFANVLRVIEGSYSRGTLIADAQSFDGSLLKSLTFGQQVVDTKKTAPKREKVWLWE